jgi:hypothetical protein
LAAEYEVEAHLFPFMAISLGDMGRAVDADAFAAAKGRLQQESIERGGDLTTARCWVAIAEAPNRLTLCRLAK